jgi:hypothetical protein
MSNQWPADRPLISHALMNGLGMVSRQKGLFNFEVCSKLKRTKLWIEMVRTSSPST